MADDKEPAFSFPSKKTKVAKESEKEQAFKYPEPPWKSPTLRSQVTPEMLSTEGASTKAILRGATVGLSDRVIALAKPGDYKKNLEKEFAQRDKYTQENPWSNVGNNIAGGLLTGGGIVNAIRAVAGKVAPAVVNYASGTGIGPMLARVAGMAGTGGAIGETMAQGQKDYGHVGDDLGEGALYGAGAQLAGTAILKTAAMALRGMSHVGQRVAMAMGAVKPEDFATRKYIESLAAKGLEPEDIIASMKKLRGDDLVQQGPTTAAHTLPDLRAPVITADVVPRTTLNTFKKGVGASDAATDKMDHALRNRASEQLHRIENTSATTLSGDMQSTANIQRHIEAGRAAAAPHYDAAYSVGSPADPRVLDWINDSKANAKLFQTLEKNLAEHASDKLNPSKPMSAKLGVAPDGTFVWEKYPSVEDLDTIKKYIDAQRTDLWDVNKNVFRQPKSLGGSSAEQLGTQRDDLVKLIDGLTPDGKGGSHYSNARKAFADEAALRDAHSTGQQVMRTRPEDVELEFKALGGNPQLEEQYRAGLASVVKDIIDKNGPGGPAIVKRLYGSPGVQQKIETVMANPPSNEQFGRTMAAEKAITDTQRTLTPRSGGQDLLGDATGFSLPLTVANTMVGRLGAAAGNLGKFATGSISNMAPEVGDELTRIALMGPEEQANWLKLYRAQQNTLAKKAGRVASSVGSYLHDGVAPAFDEAAANLTNAPQKTEETEE